MRYGSTWREALRRVMRCHGILILALWGMAGMAQSQTLSMSALADRPLLWPDQVSLREELSDGVSTWAEGLSLRVHSVEYDGVVVFTPEDEELTLLPAEATNLLDLALTTRQQLPEDARDLTLRQLVTRGDLLPQRVALTESLQMPGGKAYPAGMELVPVRLEAVGGEIALSAVDPATVQEGTLKERFHYPVASTDLVARIRAHLLGQAPAVSRVESELAGRLVDAAGQPAAVPQVAPKYYVVYFGAGSCGWCRQLAPEIAKFHQELIASRPDVQMVLLSNDASAEEMFAYMERDAMAWPAVDFARRSETPFLLGLTQGGTPHLYVLAADGRIVHDGLPAGANGVSAAMAAFRRELQQSGS